MNTGDRYQFFGVPRWRAVLFVRNRGDSHPLSSRSGGPSCSP